jgi:hypothetical protein
VRRYRTACGGRTKIRPEAWANNIATSSAVEYT